MKEEEIKNIVDSYLHDAWKNGELDVPGVIVFSPSPVTVNKIKLN